MNYGKCLAKCIAVLKAEHSESAERDIARYISHPLPTKEEWRRVEKVMATYEDVENPFDWMGQYEISLGRRGIATVLGDLVKQMISCAERAGIPHEYIPDAITLMLLRSEPGRNPDMD